MREIAFQSVSESPYPVIGAIGTSIPNARIPLVSLYSSSSVQFVAGVSVKFGLRSS